MKLEQREGRAALRNPVCCFNLEFCGVAVLYGGRLHHRPGGRVPGDPEEKTRDFHRVCVPGVVYNRPLQHHAGN